MSCYNPLTAYRLTNGTLTFKHESRDILSEIDLPCGQCIGCKLHRSRQWAIRCIHEKSMHDRNAYITLTYNNDHLPEGRTLQHYDFQKFLKRLRKHIRPLRIKYFMCGEYGTETRRPHYHALIFGIDFHDKVYHSKNHQGDNLYESPTLTRLWGLGHALIGDVTYESAAYVARYITTKYTEPGNADGQYQHFNLETGEITTQAPEYGRMSLKTAIGKEWIEKFASDVINIGGNTVHNGHEEQAPRYYDMQIEKQHPEKYKEILEHREQQKAKREPGQKTKARLKDRETVAKAKATFLKRNLGE